MAGETTLTPHCGHHCGTKDELTRHCACNECHQGDIIVINPKGRGNTGAAYRGYSPTSVENTEGVFENVKFTSGGQGQRIEDASNGRD